ncbi:MAG: ABC transporter ATP-binding protein, partial [Bdellovibrionota bacterium]
MIEVKNLSKSFEKPILTPVLRDISITIPEGTWASLMGPSGSGKSTLLSLLAGLDLPTSGELKLAGKNILRLTEDERALFRAENIGFIFQSFRLLPTLSVLENVCVPLEILGRHDARAEAEALIERVGLASRKHHSPGQLSGGEQQRVAVARAFVTRPKILLADEPTGNLDEENSALILDLLADLQRSHRSTLLVVSHDPGVAARADIRL